MMDEDIARFLRYEAAHSEGMIFTGKGASGKTTCMNALLDLIPLDKSGLVIQENEELFSDIHPDLMFQKTVLNKGEGRIQYSLQDLARNGLLLDLDVFVIGEIKGAEALYMLNASYTGHTCWASVHGASSTEGINKLVDYIKYASDYSREDALHMLTHLETVVFMKNYKIWEVSKIVGWDDAKQDLIYKPIIRENKLVVRIGEHGEVLD
jgi:pilus assembly protein CpaF